MSIVSLILASLLVCIPIVISYKEHLGLTKDIIVSVLRAIIQLIFVGYILDIIFGLDNKFALIFFVVVMTINAAINAKKRGKGIKRVGIISFIAILFGAGITLIFLILAGAVDFTAKEVIPISGMLISNSMVAIGLSFKQMENSFQLRRNEIEVKLSLGADMKVASKEIIRESIRIALIPTLDSAKTLGIVALPGMMTGLILAGTPPMEAIKFQIMVTFMILTAGSIAIIISTYLSYTSYFNDRQQLIIR